MPILPLIPTSLCLIALAGTLLALVRGSRNGRYAAKPLASLAFIAVAAAGGALASDASPYCLWIAAGLILGAVGDVALMLPGRRAFLFGLIAFLLGHIAYVVAFQCVTPMAHWFSPWALLAIAIAGVVLVWLWPHLGAMRAPVIAYVAVITCMLIGALAVIGDGGRATLSARQAQLACAGATLFFLSDLAVARQRFVHDSLRNRLWGLPAYYVAQLLLAWSALLAAG